MIFKFVVKSQPLVLASFLKEAMDPKYSAKSIKKAIEKGACRVNKKIVNYANHKLKPGDQIELSLTLQTESSKPTLVLDDPEFCIISKPSGMVSDKQSLLPYFKHPIFLVHRLDKETSGLLILAKSLKIQNYFENLFKNKLITKKYLGICDGLIMENSGNIEVQLEETKREHHVLKVVVNQHLKGSLAVTKWKKIAVSDKACFMEFEILTGKTHQIRASMHYMGHGLLGDPVYLKKPVCTFIPESLCLHAYFLSFPHPINTDQVVNCYAKLPKSFESTLKILMPHAKLPRY